MTANKYICTVCKKAQKTEDGIYSIMKTGKCPWHAMRDRITNTFNIPNFGLGGVEGYLLEQMYLKETRS